MMIILIDDYFGRSVDHYLDFTLCGLAMEMVLLEKLCVINMVINTRISSFVFRIIVCSGNLSKLLSIEFYH